MLTVEDVAKFIPRSEGKLCRAAGYRIGKSNAAGWRQWRQSCVKGSTIRLACMKGRLTGYAKEGLTGLSEQIGVAKFIFQHTNFV
ncbi:MAG: hypothetical protein QM579_10180 [Desulfovibrio sp.]|uniref:hypothetical protein n=1 Tax=Desulfovibrio sp. TaxID=885 RepID=UPI0039E5FDD0